MKLELDEYEVLSLYRLLISIKSTESDVYDYDLDKICARLENHILGSLSGKQIEYQTTSKDDLLMRWEESVRERIADKEASLKASENSVFHLMEGNDSDYPKSFKSARGKRRQKKK